MDSAYNATMEPEHKHEWRSRYIELDGYNTWSGMHCKCGERLNQEQIERLINGLKIYTCEDEGDLLFERYGKDGDLEIVYA